MDNVNDENAVKAICLSITCKHKSDVFSRTSTKMPGWTLYSDCDPPRMNIITLREQYKPIRQGENFSGKL